MNKDLYVIKYANGQYFCGLNQFDKQLRKAKIYTSKKWITEVAEELKTRKRYNQKVAPTLEYKIVKVEIKEVGE